MVSRTEAWSFSRPGDGLTQQLITDNPALMVASRPLVDRAEITSPIDTPVHSPCSDAGMPQTASSKAWRDVLLGRDRVRQIASVGAVRKMQWNTF